MNNRRTWKALPAAGAVLAAAAALTACSPQVTTQMPDVIQVQNVENQDGQISLSASETVKVTPDMARIIFAITTEHADAAQCQQRPHQPASLGEQGPQSHAGLFARSHRFGSL